MKLCECGCGLETGIAVQTDRKRGWIRGQPVRFRVGHQRRTMFKGTSYKAVRRNGRVEMIHRLRAETALGRPLPKGAIVHHADGSRKADAPLVICDNHRYHKLLHVRMRVIAFGGNPNTDKVCQDCRQPKPKSDFPKHRGEPDGLHRLCKRCACLRTAQTKAKRHVTA